MKAEHRKELETNLLADRLGRIVQGVKGGPRNISRFNFILILMAALVVGLGGFIGYRIWVTSGNTAENGWVTLEVGRGKYLLPLGSMETNGMMIMPVDNPNLGKPGISARLQTARLVLVNWGVQDLGFTGGMDGFRPHAIEAMRELKLAQTLYESLRKECKKEDEWMSEIDYHLAVIEEVRALQNPQQIDKARILFEEVAKNYPKTGFGKLAEDRAKDLKDNAKELTEIYNELGRALGVPAEAKQNVQPNSAFPTPLKESK